MARCDGPDEFDRVWEECADNDVCDAAGSMEYRRVRREWIEAGQPADIAAYIRRRANIPATG